MIGAYIIAISLGVLPYGTPLRSSSRAIFDDPQRWQITCFGIAFFCAGIVSAFSKSKHWLVSMVRITLVASFLTPMYWIFVYSDRVSTPFKIIGAIILTLGLVGVVLGLLKEVGILNIGSQPDKSSTSTVDPIRQAETYLAYGRKTQALEVLNYARNHNPSRAVEFQKKIDEILQNR